MRKFKRDQLVLVIDVALESAVRAASETIFNRSAVLSRDEATLYRMGIAEQFHQFAVSLRNRLGLPKIPTSTANAGKNELLVLLKMLSGRPEDYADYVKARNESAELIVDEDFAEYLDA